MLNLFERSDKDDERYERQLYSKINYTHTNESLEAIVRGMDVNEEDVVLTVGGSGDQGFALLEFAKEVRAVDTSRWQLEYILRRCKMLEKGDYHGFLSVKKFASNDGVNQGKRTPELAETNLKRRNEYFSEDKRLDRIKENLSCLKVLPKGDITEVAKPHTDLTKAYFSNVFVPYTKGTVKAIAAIAENLPPDGLIYITNSDYFERFLRTNYEDSSNGLPESLKFDRKLSEVARKLQIGDGNSWVPGVYRVIRTPE